MDEAKAVLDRVLGSRDLFDAPLLVMANKQDQVGAWGAGGVEESLGVGALDSRPTRVSAPPPPPPRVHILSTLWRSDTLPAGRWGHSASLYCKSGDWTTAPPSPFRDSSGR